MADPIRPSSGSGDGTRRPVPGVYGESHRVKPNYEQQQLSATRSSARDAARQHEAEVTHLEALVQATTDVRAAVQALADETSRAQRLALLVAICTTLVGAIVGGFAGAIAARIVGS